MEACKKGVLHVNAYIGADLPEMGGPNRCMVDFLDMPALYRLQRMDRQLIVIWTL
jgi:hypothetical protein